MGKKILLKVEQVAEMLGINPQTVYRWVARGTLPVTRLPGSLLRFEESAIERWVEERSTESD